MKTIRGVKPLLNRVKKEGLDSGKKKDEQKKGKKGKRRKRKAHLKTTNIFPFRRPYLRHLVLLARMLASLLFVLVPLLVVYLVREAHYRRFKQYAAFPQLESSYLWGHLNMVIKLISRGAERRHVGK